MWKEVITKAKDKIAGEVQNQGGVSGPDANKSIDLAGESIREVLSREAKQGNIQPIMELFRSRNPANSGNPLMQQITSNLDDKLVNQLNLPLDKAKGVESITLPYLINLLNQETGGTDTPPNLENLTNLLGGAENLPEDIKDNLKRFGESSF